MLVGKCNIEIQGADYIKNAGSNKQGRKEDATLLKMTLDLKATFFLVCFKCA